MQVMKVAIKISIPLHSQVLEAKLLRGKVKQDPQGGDPYHFVRGGDCRIVTLINLHKKAKSFLKYI
jgi:hypothetical protein